MDRAEVALPRVMGHRGIAAAAPENTLAGLRRAAAVGVAWVEFDVKLTGDGVPVLFHDDSLKRITGLDAPMAETPRSALRRLDAGSWFGSEFAGEPIPTLEEAIGALVELGLHPDVEIKPTPGRDEETAAAALDVLRAHWPGDRPPPLISSFSRRCLSVARRKAPDWPRGLNSWRLHWDWARAAEALACTTLHIAGNRLSRRSARRLKGAGYGLVAFTVNEPQTARQLLSWGVDCLISDAPDRIAAALA